MNSLLAQFDNFFCNLDMKSCARAHTHTHAAKWIFPHLVFASLPRKFVQLFERTAPLQQAFNYDLLSEARV